MVLAQANGEHQHFPTEARSVYDITGAGDMVLAALGLGFAAGGRPEDAIQLANVAAGIEVEREGVAVINCSVSFVGPPPFGVPAAISSTTVTICVIGCGPRAARLFRATLPPPSCGRPSASSTDSPRRRMTGPGATATLSVIGAFLRSAVPTVLATSVRSTLATASPVLGWPLDDSAVPTVTATMSAVGFRLGDRSTRECLAQ